MQKLQQVIDLTSLIRAEPVQIQSALCAENVRTPFLMALAFALEPHKKIGWMVRHLEKKTAQSSIEDLRQVEKALKQKHISYTYTLRDEVFSKKSYVCSNAHLRSVLERVGFGIRR